jgi:16S rRNA (cytosine967-C5)-methyltransferase
MVVKTAAHPVHTARPTLPPALASRAAALEILASVLDRARPLDEAIETALGKGGLESRDRAFARLLATTVIRRLGQIDDALGRLVDSKLPLRPASMMNLLRLGGAQLLFLETPPHAAVGTSVDLAAAVGLGRGKGLANAVLRRLSREGSAILLEQDAARLNTPDWLWRRWVDAYGEPTTRAIAAQHLAEPPLDISFKPGVDAAALCALLEARLLPTGTARRQVGGRIEELPGFADGIWWVQDAAAALPARLFGDLAGKTVFDFCAAPGGKTAQLAAAGAVVTAIDRSAQRLQLVARNLERLKLTATLVAADGLAWKPAGGQLADAILLDAPCTATGTARRHPDIPRAKTPRDLTQLTRLQSELLDCAVRLLRPGGMLVYSTCSLEPEEGEIQIARLLQRSATLQRIPVQPSEIGGLANLIDGNGDVRTTPAHLSEGGGLDGFFAARIIRKG